MGQFGRDLSEVALKAFGLSEILAGTFQQKPECRVEPAL
jgi:hypothetical protein